MHINAIIPRIIRLQILVYFVLILHKMTRNCLFGHVCACSAPRLSQLYLSQYLIPVYQEPGFATVQARTHVQKVTGTQKMEFLQALKAIKPTYQLLMRTEQLIAWLFQCSDATWFIKQLCCLNSRLPTRLLGTQSNQTGHWQYSAVVEASSTVERTTCIPIYNF